MKGSALIGSVMCNGKDPVDVLHAKDGAIANSVKVKKSRVEGSKETGKDSPMPGTPSDDIDVVKKMIEPT